MKKAELVQPTTLEEAVEILLKATEPADEKFIKEDNDPAVSMHFGFGMFLRNHWGLWDETTPLVGHFLTEHEITHADDMSGIILDSFCAKIRNEPFDLQTKITETHNYWLRECGSKFPPRG